MTTTAPDAVAPLLPSLARARLEGLVVRPPLSLRMRAAGNLLLREPASEWALGGVQVVGERTRATGIGLAHEVIDETHVAGGLSGLELELRQAVVAFAREHEWPAALRVSLEAPSSAGAYREAPVPLRRSFAGFDYEASCEAAIARRDGLLGSSSTLDVRYEAFVIPVRLLVFRGIGWRRSVALLSLSGRVRAVLPWAEQ